MPRSTSRRSPLRLWGASLTAAALVIGVTACSQEAPEGPAEPGATGSENISISFQWWGNDERAALTEEALDLFEAQNPGITVESSFATFDSYVTKLATQIASGGAPDLFLIPMESVKEYTEKGATSDLTSFIEDGTIAIDEIPESVQKIGQIDGAFYGFTLGTATNAFIYNPTVWAAAGVKDPAEGYSWSELTAAGEKIRASSDGATAAISDPGGAIAWFGSWLRQNGKELFTESGELGFAEKDLAAWWTLMAELRAAGVTTDAQTTTTIDQSMQNSGLARGVSAGEFAAASLTGAYADTLGAENVGIAPMPTDTKLSGMWMAGTNVAAVSPKSKNPEAAAKLLNFLINDAAGAQVLGLTRGIPLNTANYAALAPTLTGGNALVNDFVVANESALMDPDPLAPAGVSTLPADFTLIYEGVIFEQQSIADAAKALYATFQSAIS